VNTKMKKKNVM